MATAHLSVFLRRLTRGMVAETLVDQSDRQLIEQFLVRREEAVFEALLRRHGPMVYRVCWRVLQQEQDAEDAFQATFLLLAQKLCTVRKHDSLASWLHGVAQRVALKAKAQAAVRRHHEQQASVSQAVPPDEVTWMELRTVLDAELVQLPQKWRLPLILCYLEGRTQDEAAGHLGWSRTTLQRRLTEAQAALSRRLKARGIVWSAALSAVLLSDCMASASPASGLVASTIEAVAGVAAGKTMGTLASANVAALTEGVLKTMFITKLKIASFVFLMLALLGTGIGPMIGVSGNAVEAREGKSKPQPTEEAKRVQELIQQLNSDEFQKREQATQELKALGDAIVPQLEAALKTSESAEVRRRLEQLLNVAKSPIATSRSLKGEYRFMHLAWDRDGKKLAATTLAAGGEPGDSKAMNAVTLWDVQSGDVKRLAEDQIKDRSYLTYAGVGLSADGKTVAAPADGKFDGGFGSWLVLWDAETGKIRHKFKHGTEVRSLGFSPDGKMIASGTGYSSAEGDVESVKLWDAKTGRLLRTLKTRNLEAEKLVFAPDSKLLAAVHDPVLDHSGGSAEVILWDAAEGKSSQTLPDSEGILVIAFSPDGNTLMGAGRKRLRMWDVATGKTIRASDLKTEFSEHPWSALAFSPDGTTLAISGKQDDKHVIALYDVKTAKRTKTLQGHDGFIWSLVFSPDSNTLASGGYDDRTIYLWEIGQTTKNKK